MFIIGSIIEFIWKYYFFLFYPILLLFLAVIGVEHGASYTGGKPSATELCLCFSSEGTAVETGSTDILILKMGTLRHRKLRNLFQVPFAEK